MALNLGTGLGAATRLPTSRRLDGMALPDLARPLADRAAALALTATAFLRRCRG
jgi:hypothetical protein